MKKKVYIIAEAGVNHNGSMALARQLIDVAVDAGADAVKFQSFVADKEVSSRAAKASYQMKTTDDRESQLDMIRQLELSHEQQVELSDYCNKCEIEFLSTPFEMDSLHFLAHRLGLERIKVSPGDITTAPLLLEIAQLDKQVILSTGMSTLAEVEEALGVLAFGYCKIQAPPSPGAFREAYGLQSAREILQKKVQLLHCTTEYPAPFAEVNLRAMTTMHQAFGLPVGYSDHTSGIAIAIAAVAMGATIIEKHFTIDRTMPGPDHNASLEPRELSEMVSSIRQVELALGDGVKYPGCSERTNIVAARKSLVALASIREREAFSESNLGYKRPGTGISPLYYWNLLKMRANRAYAPDEVINDADFF